MYDGHLHGKGTLTFANGNHYEGIFVVFDSKTHISILGEFRYGKRDGKGVFTWHDGERYEGGFKNDKRDGYGTYFYANKDTYKGRFSNGLKVKTSFLFFLFIFSMAMALIFIAMVINMRETSKRDKGMEKELLNLRMEMFMKVNEPSCDLII